MNVLQFAVLTGCLRVSKESIFTGLNNFKVLSITDARFDEQFGFTDSGSTDNYWNAYRLASSSRRRRRSGMMDIALVTADVYSPMGCDQSCGSSFVEIQDAEPQSYWYKYEWK